MAITKKRLIGFVGVAVVGVILCAIYIQNDTSLDELVNIPNRAVPGNWAEHIEIGVIGDSWVAGQMLDRPIEQAMGALGFESEVVSSGQPGAKSRQIYRNLLLEEGAKYSSNALLMGKELDYLVVVAGVNDSAGHIGANFYAHHMALIVQAALARGIMPVIVELPEYGIEDTLTANPLSFGKRALYLRLFDNGNVDIIREYRGALRGRISPDIDGKVLFVEFSSITDDYHSSKHLYSDPAHLNYNGNLKLGELIATRIIERHMNAKQSGDNSAASQSRRQ